MKGKHYLRSAQDKLGEYRKNYLFAKDHRMDPERSRLMMLAAEDAVRSAGFTVKYDRELEIYVVSCKWDDAPEGTKNER